MPAKLSEKVEDHVIELYQRGVPVLEIGELAGCSNRSIYPILERRGVEKRRPNNDAYRRKGDETRTEYENRLANLREEMAMAYEAGATLNEVAEDFDTSQGAVKTALKEMGFDPRTAGESKRQYAVNERFFDVIDTEEKAYWLGFLTGDGWITSNGHVVGISLGIKDQDHVYRYREAIDSEHLVKFIEPKKTEMRNGRVIDAGPKMELRVYCKRMVDDLKKHGFTPTKSYDAIPSPHVPFNLAQHYWRGLVDADGSVGTQGGRDWQIQVKGTEALLIAMLDFVCGELGLPRNSIYDPDNTAACKIRWGGVGRPQAIAHLLYSDATIYLPRKKAQVDKLLTLTPDKVRTR